jgi:hypothetical protein
VSQHRLTPHPISGQRSSGFRTAFVAGLAGLAALGSLAIATRTYRLTQQGQITDRYTRAIEQLGSDKLDVRLGGIYALERIANDSPSDRATIAEVLTAFVRGHAPWPPLQPDQPARGPSFAIAPMRVRAPDVQAILTVLARRKPVISSAGSLDLRTTDLRGVDLTGARLHRANLYGAQLRGAGLDGAQLQEASLGDASLKEASLVNAQLQGAYLWHSNLRLADLRGAQLQGADLRDAKLEGAEVASAQLQGARCNADTGWPRGFDWKAAGAMEQDG